LEEPIENSKEEAEEESLEATSIENDGLKD
jgi:hypothetical protein